VWAIRVVECSSGGGVADGFVCERHNHGATAKQTMHSQRSETGCLKQGSALLPVRTLNERAKCVTSSPLGDDSRISPPTYATGEAF
jgi:hypothetical protein